MTPLTSDSTPEVNSVGILDTSVVIELPNLSAAELPAFEELIAATALAHDIPLYTRNAQDFEGITGLDLRPVTLKI